MKKIDDSKIYYIFGIVTLILGVLLAISAYYSILNIKPGVNELLSTKEKGSANYKKAYIILRTPHLFAGYDNLDSEEDLQLSLSKALEMNLDDKEELNDRFSKTFSGRTAIQAIKYFDKKISLKEDITEDEKKYLEVLLDRRMKGANLARNSMVFVLALSFLSWIFFFYEKKVAASYRD